MRVRMAAVLLMGLGLAMVDARAQQPGQTEDAGQGANPSTSQPRNADPGAGIDMGHCGGMGHCGNVMPGKPLPTGAMRISFGGKSADWTPTALAALPHKTVTVHNEHTKADETYSGVPLIDLLVQLGLPAKPHGKDLALYLVAIGADGYRVVYSAAEVNPDVHDATVLVADSEGGKPIAADGPLKLVATGEARPARWVRNLVGVRVLAAQ